MIKEELYSQVIWPLAGLVLTGVFTWLGLELKDFIKKKKADGTTTSVIQSCVLAMEQMYPKLSGSDRYKMCVDYAQKILESKGIPITTEELQILIEASVGAFNGVFNKDDEAADQQPQFIGFCAPETQELPAEGCEEE